MGTNNIKRLDGKVCIVTGSGGGIGREEALLFAAEGAKVVVKERARNNFPVSLPMHPAWRRCKIST